MADPKQLAILKRGVKGWNDWRGNNRPTSIDLRGAHLQSADLRDADLRDAHLGDADLRDAHLQGAHLQDANLHGADLRNAHLRGAHLQSADLQDADLRDAVLQGADLSACVLGWSNIGNVDLGVVLGLEDVKHRGPSTIGIDTLYRSAGKIPEAFLRGAGVPEELIAYLPSLINAKSAIQFYSCFISYSSKDQPFAERLYADLQANGVRCWFAPENLKIGDRLRDEIEQSIRLYDRLLLVLSCHSVESDWVQREVETAFEKERTTKKLVLFPVQIDNAVMTSRSAWAADIRQTRCIGDFMRWKEHDAYQVAFNRLKRDLNAAPAPPTP